MTPITNISMAPSANAMKSASQVSLSHTSNEMRQQPQQADLSICRPSSTLINLLKQRRTPPPSNPSLINDSSPITTSQRKQTLTIKQPKKTSKKSQIKKLPESPNNTNSILVSFQGHYNIPHVFFCFIST